MKNAFILIGVLFFLTTCGNKNQVATDPDVYYTCSMDPQVISDKPGKCPICKMELTPVRKSKEGGNDALQLSDQQIQLGNIKTDTIRTGNIGNQVVLTATLNFDQSKTASVSSRVMGRVERLYFKNVGDYVDKGAPLFDIYSEELNNAEQEYLLALQRRHLFNEQSIIDFEQIIQSAKNKLRLWGLTEAQITHLAKSGKATPLTTFYSTASGYITQLNATEGDYVPEGGIIVQLANLSTLWAEAQVYASQMADIDQGGVATVQLPDWDNRSFTGRITFVNPEIATDSRVNLIRVSISNTGNQLRPGMPAYVLLKSRTRSSLTLPVDAVIREANGATVWVQTGAHSFKNKMVTVGMESEGQVEITSGLNKGDIVVLSGAYLLHSEFVFKRGANPMAGHNH
jgi:Cu(I)/Ag(I) efflux system membrane fusion protein